MKKYLLKLALFFAIIAVIDFAFGKVCDYLRDHTKGGFSGNVHYICEESCEDIIMMGSSRMRHHYVPKVFEDSLGMTCYNAGIDGNGIILSYGFLEIILQRYTPKLIIYDVTNFDMYAGDNTKFLASLKSYYHKPGIADIFCDVQPTEKLKMLSGLYRYNSDFLGLIGDNVKPMQSFDKGYWPSTQVMDYEPQKPDESSQLDVDMLKLEYVRRFISLARENDIQLVFIASPTYYGSLLSEYNNPIKEICKRECVPFIDDFADKLICSSKEYWSNATHMNDKGARCFSRTISVSVRQIIEKGTNESLIN